MCVCTYVCTYICGEQGYHLCGMCAEGVVMCGTSGKYSSTITHNANTSHHLVLVGSDNNYMHDPVQNVPDAGRLHPPSSGGLVARGNMLAAGLLLCQVLQTANLCDGRTEEGHHSAREGRRLYVRSKQSRSPGS